MKPDTVKGKIKGVMKKGYLKRSALLGLILFLGGLGVFQYSEYQRKIDEDFRGYNKPEKIEEEEGIEGKDRRWTKEEAQKYYHRFKEVQTTLDEYNQSQNSRRKKISSGGGATYASGQLSGEWKSRGPYNMPGAFQFVEMDEGTDTIYAVTCGHYGGVQFIWKGTLTDDKWNCINPKHPARFDDLNVFPYNGKRRVLAGQQYGDLIYSDDSGENWSTATGLNSSAQSTIINRQDGNVIYSTDGRYVYKSTNGATSFSVLQDFGSNANNTRLYSPRWSSQPGAEKVYLVRDGSFYTLNGAKTSFTLTGSLPVNNQIAVAGDDRKLWIVLKGEVWHSSTNGGATWSEVNTTGYWYNDVTDHMSAGQFIGVSPKDPDVLIGGYSVPLITQNAGVTTNGDSRNYWGYYQNAVNNDPKVRNHYHPDFQSSQFFYDKDGKLITLRSSDGGIFISYNEWTKSSFPTYSDIQGVYYNISLYGKPTQEAYRGGFMYGYQHKDHLSVGTQDQGWQDVRASTIGQEDLSWNQVRGGDGPCCITGDGQIGWKYNYFGNKFSRIQLYNGNTFAGQNGTTSAETEFTFSGSTYFTPSVGDWDNGDRIWVISRSLRRIEYNGGTITAKEDLFGTGNSFIQGVAQSRVAPDIVYTMRNGIVYKSTDRGTNWSQIASSTATGISGYYQNRGMGWSSPIDQNVVLFATGSGTAVKTIFSEDGGTTWQNVTGSGANLFPSAEVNGIAGDKNGKYVFASTDMGPYVFIVAEKKWYPMATDADIPVFWGQIVYCVDYGDKEIVHFSTWGQGIWDFEIESISYDHNVTLQSLNNNSTVTCGGTIDPTVTIKNSGNQTLTSLDIKIYVKGSLIRTINHSTSLNKFETEDITISGLPIDGDGNENIKVVLESPNGQTDQNLADNEKTITLDGSEVSLGVISGVSASSESSGNGIANTIDDDNSTFWHNNWQASTPMPHELVYDLGDNYSVTGIKLLSRQNNFNGIIKDIEVSMSDDGTNWNPSEAIVCNNSIEWETYTMSTQTGRYFKLKINSNQYSNDIASLAEIRFIGCQNGGLTAKIDSPVGGTEFATGDNVTITASATSDGTISRVEFYQNDVLVGTDNTADYSFTINNLAEGNHELKVIAYDDINGSKESSTVTISVVTPVNYDIAISNLARSDSKVCGSTVDVEFDVTNNGVINLTEFTAEVYLNNQLVNSSTESLSLSEGNSSSISIDANAIQTYGDQTLKVVLSAPNGQVDEVLSDNEASISFNIGEGDLHEFFISERSANPSMNWVISESGNVVVQNSDVTANISGSNKTQQFCLANGCYDIVVTDAFVGGNCSADEWQSGVEYCGGIQVARNGKLYESKWCGSGNDPATAGEWGQWTDLGECAQTFDTDEYGISKVGESAYVTTQVQNYTSPETNNFCNGTPIVVDFTSDKTSATNCGETVTYSSTTTPTGTDYSWNFGAGATPQTASGIGPHNVSYTTTGSKSISLTVDGVTESKSNLVTITDATVTPTISISSDVNNICDGNAVNFSIASQTNQGSNPSYEWFVNNASAGTGTTYSSSSLNNGDVVKAVLTSDAACTSTDVANSNEIAISVNQNVTPALQIQASETTICDGTEVDFSISSQTNQGSTPSYEWFVNNASVGTGTAYSSSSLSNGDVVKAVLTSNETCVTSANVNSNEITISTSGNITPSITIAASETIICPNEQVTFTTTATGGGTNPRYAWKVNGTQISTAETFTTSGLADGDQVTCELTSNSACATTNLVVSNTVSITVQSVVTPTITITSSETSICESDLVEFNSTISGGGNNPTVEWFINGNSEGLGTNLLVNSLQDSDEVSAVLTSNSACASQPDASSNIIQMAVASSIQASLTINTTSVFPVCIGNEVEFTAQSSNLGTSAIEWYVNDMKVDEGTSLQLEATNNDMVRAQSTSDLGCVSNSQVSSNEIQIEAENCVSSVTTLGDKDYVIYPNPSQDIVNISGESITRIELISAIGQVILSSEVNQDNYQLSTSDLSSGVYYLRIYAKGGSLVKEIKKD